MHGQSREALEIILIDKSDTPAIYSGCTHLISENIGPCSSRNKGAKKSKGEILVFLDDDARIEKDFLFEITEPIYNQKSSAVAGAICNEKGEFLKKNNNYFKSNTGNFIKAITNNPDSDKSRFTLSFPAGCSAILKEVFTDLGGFDENFDPTGAGEDREFAIKLFVNGNAIFYNSKAKLLHIGASKGGSIGIGSRSENLDINTIKICKKYFSNDITENLKASILKKYKIKVISNLWKFQGFRTRLSQYLRMKKHLY